MSVLTYNTGDRFIIRTKKHHTNNPNKPFYNTWEAVAGAGGSIGGLENLAIHISDFEIMMSGSFILFDQVTVATWTEDSVPYNPENFLVMDLEQQPGAVTIEGNPEPLEMCLWLKRSVTVGRLGKLFLRGALGENDVESPAGDPILSNASNQETALTAALADSILLSHFTSGVATLKLAMISADGSSVRQLTGLAVAGVRNVNMNHRWFNRVTA